MKWSGSYRPLQVDSVRAVSHTFKSYTFTTKRHFKLSKTISTIADSYCINASFPSMCLSKTDWGNLCLQHHRAGLHLKGHVALQGWWLIILSHLSSCLFIWPPIICSDSLMCWTRWSKLHSERVICLQSLVHFHPHVIVLTLPVGFQHIRRCALYFYPWLCDARLDVI